MFNLRKLSAFFSRQLTPYQAALRALARGEYAQAEREFSALLEVETLPAERAAILNKRGISRVHQGRRNEALADFGAALDLQPGYAPSLVNVGNLLLEDGDLDEAIAHYEKAIRSDDDYGIAHMNLSAAYKQAGRHADSVREFRRAGRIEGRFFKKKNP